MKSVKSETLSTESNLDELKVISAFGPKQTEAQPSPRTLLLQLDHMRLYHYQNHNTPYRLSQPLLICSTPLYHPSILDLSKKHSFIRCLLKHGINVYLVEWEPCGFAEHWVSLEDSITEYLHMSVLRALKHSTVSALHVAGFGLGGTFCVIHAALNTQIIKTITAISAPIRSPSPDQSALLETASNKLTKVLSDPLSSGLMRYLKLCDHLDNPNAVEHFLQIERWRSQPVGPSKELLRSLTRDVYKGNKLFLGELTVGHQTVDLKTLFQPILNMYGNSDADTPLQCSECLEKSTSSAQFTNVYLSDSHLNLLLNTKQQHQLANVIAGWLKSCEG